MNKTDKANPDTKKGQKLQAKEEKIKQRLEKRKQKFENPNLLKRKVADYRKQYQQRKTMNNPNLAQKMEQKNKEKNASIQALYDKNKTQLQARAIERRLREAVPDQEKPNLSELAKNKQKALAKEKLDERAMKQSAGRMAERFEKEKVSHSSFKRKPNYPWDSNDTNQKLNNPFVIDEK